MKPYGQERRFEPLNSNACFNFTDALAVADCAAVTSFCVLHCEHFSLPGQNMPLRPQGLKKRKHPRKLLVNNSSACNPSL